MCLSVFRSSVLIFFGSNRAVAGLVILGFFYMAILVSSPYVQSRNDLLQQLVQTELYLLLLAAHTLDASPDSEQLLDTVLSVILLAVTLAIVLIFILLAVAHVRDKFQAELRRKKIEEHRKKSLSSSSETPNTSGTASNRTVELQKV
jgi:hypothetical protein